MYENMKDKVNFRINCQYDLDIKDDIRINDEVFDYLVLSVGRSGAWFMDSLYNGILPHLTGATDVGIRYECNNEVFSSFYENSYEHKLSMRSSYDEVVRSFRACLKDGYVTYEKYKHSDINCVNGHSYTDGDSGNANFAILVTVEFTKPFNNPNNYCKSICQTCNNLAGGGSLVQAHEDLLRKRRSTERRIKETGIVPSLPSAVPGDISFALPYRHMCGIMEFIDALEGVFPGVRNGLMYAPEVKFYTNKAVITDELNYKGYHNIYPAGDCSGWTRSLAQAAAHGIIVGEKINNCQGQR